MQPWAVAAFVAIILRGGMFCQSTPPPTFEVASIKPADPNAHGDSLNMGRAGDLNATNVPLRHVIEFAFDIREFQLSGGPGWIGTERYDIIAKTERGESAAEMPDPRSMTDEQRKVLGGQLRERVRSLLADRFGLVVHHETKNQPVYVLTIAKNGPRMKLVTTPGDRQGTSGNGRGRVQGFAATMTMITMNLSDILSRPVLDKTGLTEKYDFVLEWTPDAALARPDGPDAAPPADSSGPTIFTAVQEQLGLKLESTKGPVDTIVIDHVDRPSAN